MTSRRPYDNRRREARAGVTADRIVAALCELLVDERPALISIPAVARRANVSTRTVYSHFPTKEALFAAIPAHVDRRARELTAAADLPTDPHELNDIVRAAVLALAPLAPLFEALVRAGIDDDDHARKRNQQHVAYIVERIEPLTPSIPAPDRVRLAGLITSILNHPVVVRLQRNGEDVEGTIELLTWLLELAVAESERAGGFVRSASTTSRTSRTRRNP